MRPSGGSASYYFGFDQEGSVRILTDQTAVVTSAYSYTAFGEELSFSPTNVFSPYGYGGLVGYYPDIASSRIYVRARHYQQKYARWMSRDLIVFPRGDVNLCRYVGNDPVNPLDPSGTLQANLLSALTAPMAPIHICAIVPSMHCPPPCKLIDCDSFERSECEVRCIFKHKKLWCAACQKCECPTSGLVGYFDLCGP
jgi:RHS repeat-associated protein